MRDRQDFQKRDVAKAIAFTLCLFVILWLRRPDCLLNAQFWAEDGGLFFREQVLFGFWGTLTRPYSGYLHVIPRMVTAALVDVLPVRWAPLGFNLSALLIDAVCCGAFFWPCFRKMIASDSLRAVCCLIVASATVAGNELVGTLCNVQWFLCLLSLLLIVVAARTIWGGIGLTLLQVCIALTAPAALLFIPFLLLQIKNNPGRLRFRPTIHLIAIFLQAWKIREDFSGAHTVPHFNIIFLGTLSSGLSRCVLSPLLGARFLIRDSTVGLFSTLAIALAAGAVLLTLLTPRLRGTQRMTWFVSASYIGVGSLVLALGGRGIIKEFVTLEGLRWYTAERYFLIGASMFVFCMAFAVETFVRSEKWRPAVLAAIFAWGAIHNFSSLPFIDKHWKENAPKIEAWQAARKRHEKVETLIVPINPNLQLELD